jgi:DNA-binding MarR family transcriptional regulator
VANEIQDHHDSVGAWAKRYYFASKSAIESVLRSYDVGSTQWYVLYQLANEGPTMQRDLGQMLHIERATLSGVVATLVRKGFIDQVPDADDQRQRLLRITPAGSKLWRQLPDPIAVIQAVSFEGADDAELATTIRVLQAATGRLNDHLSDGDTSSRLADRPEASA